MWAKHEEPREREFTCWMPGCGNPVYKYDSHSRPLCAHHAAGYPDPAKAVKRPGRNDPCTCGSGQKFKKCCLNGRQRKVTHEDPIVQGA